MSGIAKKAPGFVIIAAGGNNGEAAAAAAKAGFVISPIRWGEMPWPGLAAAYAWWAPGAPVAPAGFGAIGGGAGVGTPP